MRDIQTSETNAVHKPTTPEQKQAIETLVDRILTAKQADPSADVQPLETQIA